jgi:broad specificity phosphatase PhoE
MVGDKIGGIVLYVIRHAEVAEDAEGTIRGLLNPPLDPKGRRDAKTVAKFFKDIPFSFVATDDLKRTQQTAKPLSDAKGLRMEIDPDLRAWDVGTELEGEDIEENKDEIAKLKTHSQLVPVGGQSWGNYERQVGDSFDRYVDRSLGEVDPGAIVVHGSYIQILAVRLGYSEPDEAYDHTPVDPAGIIAIYLTRAGLVMKILEGERQATDE